MKTPTKKSYRRKKNPLNDTTLFQARKYHSFKHNKNKVDETIPLIPQTDKVSKP